MLSNILINNPNIIENFIKEHPEVLINLNTYYKYKAEENKRKNIKKKNQGLRICN